MIMKWSSASVWSRLGFQISHELEPSMKLSAGQVHSNRTMRCASSKPAGWCLAYGLLSVATGLQASNWLTMCARPRR